MTDYPRSLALWAGTSDDARLSEDETERASYWTSFRQAIRRVEMETQLQEELDAYPAAEAGGADEAAAPDVVGGGDTTTARPLSTCQSQARYGSGPNTVRMGKEYTAAELKPIVPELFGFNPTVTSKKEW